MTEVTFRDTSGSTRVAYTTFGSTDMLEALVLMADISAQAHKVGLENIAPRLRVLLQRLEGELAVLATKTAQLADAAIVYRLRETQVRPETTKSLHLQDLIVSIPFSSGSVKIGLIDELDKATNPQSGYGPYWRAQEEGSVAVGNTMTGRVLFGRFEGPSHDDVPRGEYSGSRGAPGSEFYFDVPGQESGLGTIEHEDQPRHFLEEGAATAGVSYAEGIRRLSRTYAELIDGLAV